MQIQKSNIIRFLLIVTVLTFSSCYNYRSVGLLQENNHRLPIYPKDEYRDYQININDELIFRLITSDQTISTLIQSNQSIANTQNAISYRVYPDGTVDLPFVKNIQVLGMTLNEAAIVIENRFKELIPDAAVKLTLANKTFTVIGEAGTGVFQINRDKLTIYQALSMSGELNLSGDFKKIRILREHNNKTEILTFDIRPRSLIESKYYYIYPNDIIYVQTDPSSFYKVNNFSSFMGLVTTSLTLMFTVLYYFNN
jgi:polysaccharide export outer membrane protein